VNTNKKKQINETTKKTNKMLSTPFEFVIDSNHTQCKERFELSISCNRPLAITGTDNPQHLVLKYKEYFSPQPNTTITNKCQTEITSCLSQDTLFQWDQTCWNMTSQHESKELNRFHTSSTIQRELFQQKNPSFDQSSDKTSLSSPSNNVEFKWICPEDIVPWCYANSSTLLPNSWTITRWDESRGHGFGKLYPCAYSDNHNNNNNNQRAFISCIMYQFLYHDQAQHKRIRYNLCYIPGYGCLLSLQNQHHLVYKNKHENKIAINSILCFDRRFHTFHATLQYLFHLHQTDWNDWDKINLLD
jgi:hypothetical protein